MRSDLENVLERFRGLWNELLGLDKDGPSRGRSGDPYGGYVGN